MEFDNLAIIGCVLLLVYLLFQEYRRANRARLIWRILASILAVGCFAGMFFRFSYVSGEFKKINELNLVDESVPGDTISRLNSSVYSLSVKAKKSNGKQVKTIADLSYFLKSHPEINQLNVWGYGFTKAQLDELGDYALHFKPSALPEGFLSATWNRTPVQGSSLLVQGSYHNPAQKHIRILLRGLGTNLDSLTVKSGTKTFFSFETLAPQGGKAVYQLIALQGKDTLAVEPVPLEIQPAPKMRVLILASNPDFEYKFLKNWLYTHQYPLVFRSRISKDKYTTDFLNVQQGTALNISSGGLKNTDLVVVDETEMAALTAAERSSIYQQVQNGMGLLIRAENGKSISGFDLYETPVQQHKPLKLSVANEPASFAAVDMEQNLFLKPGAADQPLIKDGQDRVLVNSKLNGRGKVLVSAVAATYQWQLNGASADYTRFWSLLLAKATRSRNAEIQWQPIPAFPEVGVRSRLLVHTNSAAQVPQLSVNGTALSPRQQLELPFQWDAFYWPEKTGWQNLTLNRIPASFYVYHPDNWKVLRHAAQLDATKLYAAKHQQVKAAVNGTGIIKREVSLWWFFFGFILAAGFLWYESRIPG